MSNSYEKDSAVGTRWAAVLVRLYPGQRPGTLAHKAVAGAFGVSERTALVWAEGQAPQARQLVRLWELHGFAAVAEVLSPSDGDRQRLMSQANGAQIALVAASLQALAGQLAGMGSGCG